MFALEVTNGPLDGKRWPFAAQITIGRDGALVEAALPVDRAVSRRHARLCVEGSELVLSDLHSSNGTMVNGEPIDAPVKLKVGQTFSVGHTAMRIIEIADGPL